MSLSWELDFRKRMDSVRQRQTIADGIPISIKIRITGGCFHREHSPEAYRLIDEHLRHLDPMEGIAFEEHESGPEVLICLAYTTVVMGLAKSVIDLITAIIKARSEGVKKGDRPSEPLELLVRTTSKDGEYFDEQVLHILHQHPPDSRMIAVTLTQAINKILERTTPERGAQHITHKTTPVTRSKQSKKSKETKEKKRSLNARRRKKRSS